MPEPFPGTGVERDDRVGEQVLALAIRAIVVPFAGAGGNKRNTALFVDGELIPVDSAARALPEIFGPSLVSEFAGAGYRMELPHQFSRAHIVGVNIAWDVGVVAAAAHHGQDDKVYENAAGIVGLNGRRIAPV